VRAALAQAPALARATIEGLPVLLLAAREGHVGVLQELLHVGADAGARDGAKGMCALAWAARYGHEEALQWLLTRHKSAFDVNARDFHQLTPLHHAVLGSSEACARALLAEGASKGLRDAKGNTPSRVAAGLLKLGRCSEALLKAVKVN
jgi:hypothetical protein